ncbi:MAG: HipA domain-containing protein [Candidatus Obscuribacterales bacterium]|jgi:serine/threonine-protein kinase HipA
MISKDETKECFVYITLPGATTSVTAGRIVLGTDRRGDAFGRFIYGASYLANEDSVEIDPVELRLTNDTHQTARRGGLFGALRDASPDYWGRRLIEKHAGKPQLGELDYLLKSPDDRAGALAFGLGKHPPAPIKKFNQTIALEKLQLLADRLINDEFTVPIESKAISDNRHDAIQAQELLLLGTSMGGARPKAVIEDDTGLWLAKFNRPDDRWNNPKVEHAMLTLAKSCGINAARSRIETVGGKDVLLVQRFDREKNNGGYFRARMISALTLLRAEESSQQRERWSYILLAEELRRTVAEPKKDAAELFRRMCFNALISNLDDHPRNHALIAFEHAWKLSPAYDLTPTPTISVERRDLAMACGDLGRFANKQNLLSQSARFLLSKEEATAIIAEMQMQVRSTWFKIARAAGVTERDSESIKDAFVYDGFSYE